MSFTKYNPFPRKFGNGRTMPLQQMEESYKSNLGTALNSDTSVYRNIKIHVIARALYAAALDLQRSTNQLNPKTITTNLYRWEKICGLLRNRYLPDQIRRDYLAIHFGLFGTAATIQQIIDQINIAMDGNFVAVSPITQTQAAATGAAAIDGGATIPGGATLPDGDFSSAVCLLPIQMNANLNSMKTHNIQQLTDLVLDDLLPAWMDWAIYNNTTFGFYLDISSLDVTAFGA